MRALVLDNGLQIVVQPKGPAPLVCVWLLLDVGAIDEPVGAFGVAHLLEHMLFKGTPSRAVGVAASEIEALGGDLNAWTSYDHTAVHATIEREQWLNALDVVADLVTSPLLGAAELESERLVVLEELRSYQDDPASVLDDAVCAGLWPDHPYGRPVAGTVETVSAIDHAALRAFWADHYGADRARLVIVGDVDAEAALAAAQARLSGWARARVRRGDAPAHQPPVAPSHPAGQRLNPKGRFDTPVARLSWPLPPASHADHPALAVLAAGLGGTGASLLSARLDFDKNLVIDVEADTTPMRWAASFDVHLRPREHQTVAALRGALEVIEEVRRDGLGGVTLARARDTLLADALFEEETVDGVADTLAQDLSVHGEAGWDERYLRAIGAVTDEDIRAVVARWLAPEAAVVAVVDPDQPALPADLLAPVPQRAPRGQSPVRHVFPSGLTLVVLPDSGRVAAFKLSAVGGRWCEPLKSPGLAAAWERLITDGAGDLDASSFQEALDDLSATLDAGVLQNSLSFAGSCPAQNTRGALELLADAVLAPRFAAEEWARVREELSESITQRIDRPDEVMSDLLWGALWPDHPWGSPTSGTTRGLATLKPSTFKRWHSSQFTGPNLVLALAGGVDPDDAIRWVGEAFAELDPAPPSLPTPLTAPERAGVHRAKAGREQAWIALGARAPRFADPDRVAVELGMSVLGSQSGRLFHALREARGLAYDVFSGAHIGWWGGVLQVGLVCSPNRADEARAALRAEVERLCDEGTTADELERVKRNLVGTSAMSLQRAYGRAADAAGAERGGYAAGVDALRARLAPVRPEQVTAALHRWLRALPVEAVVEPRP